MGALTCPWGVGSGSSGNRAFRSLDRERRCWGGGQQMWVGW